MSESVKIRIVIEEVVVDYESSFTGTYSHASIEALITKTVKAAIELHHIRHGAEE